MKTDHFRHCLRCGREGVVLEERKLSCTACNFQVYLNTASAVGALIFHEEQLVFTIRGKEPQLGMLDLPGGFVEYQETAEEALAREVKEELNLTLTDIHYFTSFPNTYLYREVEYQVLDFFFTSRPQDIDLIRAGDDAADYALYPPEKVDLDKVAFISSRNAIQQLLRSS